MYHNLLQLLSNYGMFSTLREDAADAFLSMVSVIRYWCMRDMNHEQCADVILDKILSKSDDNRIASSEFIHYANKVSLHFTSNTRGLRVSPFVVMLLCLAQSMYENTDEECIKETP